MIGATVLLVLLHAAPPTLALSTVMEVQTPSGRGLATPINSILAVTAAHVVNDTQEVSWRQGMAAGTARVISVLQKKDLAILRVAEGEQFPFSAIVAKDAPRVFDEIFYVAYDWQGVRGLIRGELTFKYEDSRWGCPSFGWFGMSGGGVFNAKGELVGVLTQVSQGMSDNGTNSRPFISIPITILVEARGMK